jgi:hypothetical protein
VVSAASPASGTGAGAEVTTTTSTSAGVTERALALVPVAADVVVAAAATPQDEEVEAAIAAVDSLVLPRGIMPSQAEAEADKSVIEDVRRNLQVASTVSDVLVLCFILDRSACLTS